MGPCMCGGCRRCLMDQGWKPCPKCDCVGGCDCVIPPEDDPYGETYDGNATPEDEGERE